MWGSEHTATASHSPSVAHLTTGPLGCPPFHTLASHLSLCRGCLSYQAEVHGAWFHGDCWLSCRPVAPLGSPWVTERTLDKGACPAAAEQGN